MDILWNTHITKDYLTLKQLENNKAFMNLIIIIDTKLLLTERNDATAW